MIISNNKTNFNKNLEYNFGGGDITSDAGIILIKEFDEK